MGKRALERELPRAGLFCWQRMKRTRMSWGDPGIVKSGLYSPVFHLFLSCFGANCHLLEVDFSCTNWWLTVSTLPVLQVSCGSDEAQYETR